MKKPYSLVQSRKPSHSLHLGGSSMQKLTAVCSTWKKRSSSLERELPCIHWSQGLSSGGGGRRRQPHSGGGLSGEEGRAVLYFKTQDRSWGPSGLGSWLFGGFGKPYCEVTIFTTSFRNLSIFSIFAISSSCHEHL